MNGLREISSSSAFFDAGLSRFGVFVSASTRSVPSDPSAASYAVTMSALASSGSAIGYLMSPSSWIFLAASFISANVVGGSRRSEEHTSELQSRQYLVCRLLLEKKKQSKS